MVRCQSVMTWKDLGGLADHLAQRVVRNCWGVEASIKQGHLLPRAFNTTPNRLGVVVVLDKRYSFERRHL